MSASTPFGRDDRHYSRQFNSGWGARAATAADIAKSVQALCGVLAELQPDHRDIWPLFEMRAIKPGRDPGPIMEISPDDLARLIDRKARFDPPQLPAPVSSEGYSLVISSRNSLDHPRHIGLSVSAGVYGEGVHWNGVEVKHHIDNPIWQDRSAALRVIEALVDAFAPDWVCANAFVFAQVANDQGHREPWMAWSAPGHETPAYWTEHGGEPFEITAAFDGELRLWL